MPSMKKPLDQITKNIPKEDRENPTIIFLLELFEQQFGVIHALKEQNQILRDEIARLKNQKPKPKIRPGKLAKDANKKYSPKRSNPQKRKKTAQLKIHKEERIAPEHIPQAQLLREFIRIP